MRYIVFTLTAWFAVIAPIFGYDISTGLVAKWGFDGTSNDASTNSYHAALINGVQYGQGTNLQCLIPVTNGGFPQYANAGHGAGITNISNQLTLAAWVYYTGPNGTGGGRSTILSRYNTPNIFIFDIAEPPNLLRLVLYTNGGSAFFSASSAFPSNRWVHVAAVYNGATVVVYTNGISNFGGVATGNLKGSTTCDTLIGARADNLSNFVWNGGGMDEVCIFNRALSSIDVAALAAGIPTASLTNVLANQKITTTQTLRGVHQSPVGLKETRLILSNSGGELTNMIATPDGVGGWYATPTLPVGSLTAVVVTTNSNDTGYVSPAIHFQVTTYSTLTVQSLKENGEAWVGGLVYGPGSGPFNGLRTNGNSGESLWASVEVGALVGLTNYSTQKWGGTPVVTQWVMPASNASLLWVIPQYAPAAILEGGGPATCVWFPNRSRVLEVSLPKESTGARAVAVRIYPLHGGGARDLYSGIVNSERLEINVSPLVSSHLSAGLWVLESRIRAMGTDEQHSLVLRKLVMIGR